MSELSEEHISRYVMSAFGRPLEVARIPRRKPDGRNIVTTARIVLSVQYENKFRFMTYDPIDIRSDSADWYGYEDNIPVDAAPSVLDVIAQVHERVYGDAFSKDTCRDLLDVDENGIMQKVLGEVGRFTCFVINGQYSYDVDSDYDAVGFRGLGCTETPVYDLDVVEVFSFPASIGLDYYTYFMKPDGTWARSIHASVGEKITVKHEGYLFAIGGPYVHEDRIEKYMVSTVRDSQLAAVRSKTYEMVDLDDAVTDDDGLTTFEMYAPGHYYITAYGGSTGYPNANLSLPWLPVIVG